MCNQITIVGTNVLSIPKLRLQLQPATGSSDVVLKI